MVGTTCLKGVNCSARIWWTDNVGELALIFVETYLLSCQEPSTLVTTSFSKSLDFRLSWCFGLLVLSFILSHSLWLLSVWSLLKGGSPRHSSNCSYLSWFLSISKASMTTQNLRIWNFLWNPEETLQPLLCPTAHWIFYLILLKSFQTTVCKTTSPVPQINLSWAQVFCCGELNLSSWASQKSLTRCPQPHSLFLSWSITKSYKFCFLSISQSFHFSPSLLPPLSPCRYLQSSNYCAFSQLH